MGHWKSGLLLLLLSQLDTIGRDTKWRQQDLLNYSLLSLPLLTLGQILFVSYISVCQYDEAVKVICWSRTKQTFWFGVSSIKQNSTNLKSCPQSNVFPLAMHGQSGWIRWHLPYVESIQRKHNLVFEKASYNGRVAGNPSEPRIWFKTPRLKREIPTKKGMWINLLYTLSKRYTAKILHFSHHAHTK